MTMNSIDSQSSYLIARNVDAEFNLGEPTPDNMFAPEAYHIDSSMQGSWDTPDFNHPRASQAPYSVFACFTGGPVYPEAAQQFVHGKHSPHPSPFESPEIRAPSNLSTASGPSATSSAMGSPYSNPGQTVSVPEWGSGLGISPSIAGGPYDTTYGCDFGYPVPGMDELTYQKIYVGECAIPASSSSMSSVIPSNPAAAVKYDFDQERSNANMLRSTQSPVSVITPTSSGGDFLFKSPSTTASSFSPLSTRRVSVFSIGNSSAAGLTQDCRSSPFPSAQSFQSEMVQQSSHNTYQRSPFFSQTSGQFVAPLESRCLFSLSSFARAISSSHMTFHSPPANISVTSDPSLIDQYTGPSVQTSMASATEFEHQSHIYTPHSPTPSNLSAQSSSRPVRGSQSPYHSNYQKFPYPPRRPSLMSLQSPGSPDGSFNSDESAKGKCPNPDCGKIFKDLKAHMLTHMNERPEKCPITTCDYHIKGFARKYDKNRHTLTHYKGTMVCGFCPGSGSSAEKSFNRADVFKRHLTSVHAVEQTPPNSRKKTSGGVNAGKKLAGYAPDATGKCSTCSAMFQNAQDFYEHLDDCVLRIVQQEEPSEAINAQRLAEVENDPAVHETLRHNGLPIATINHFSADEEEDEEEYDDADDDDYTVRGSKVRRATKASRISPNGSVQKSRAGGLTHSKGGVTLHTKGRKKRKDYPNSWGCPTPQMKMKKRVMCAFDGTRRLWKDDMMLSTDYEVRIPLSDGKSYVTDLDIQTVKRAEAFHNATVEEKGSYEEEMDLEKLMEVKSERSTSADTLS